jgi:hypothetical protein
MRQKLKALVWALAFSRWDRPCSYEQGYTILLASPMDMPFMLRVGLEGLQHINTESCQQILVVPDGASDDDGAALKEVLDDFDDPRIEMVPLRRRDRFWVRRMHLDYVAGKHWLQIVNGTRHARCEYAFQHDADAFFLERDGLERQYQECRDRRMYTLGVTERWDPFYRRLDMKIPGTWETMYSTRWARSRSPYALKSRPVETPDGINVFDTMLYPQYLDYASGRIGVLQPPPQLVHFNGAIHVYRLFMNRQNERVHDEFFRLLLLSLLEEVLVLSPNKRHLPAVLDLVAGLTDPNSRIRYTSSVCFEQYPIFRRLVHQLCSSPIFVGTRGETIKDCLKPFDEHFDWTEADIDKPDTTKPFLRESGLV